MLQAPTPLNEVKIREERCLRPYLLISLLLTAAGIVTMSLKADDWITHENWRGPTWNGAMVATLVLTILIGCACTVLFGAWIMMRCFFSYSLRESYERVQSNDLDMFAHWTYKDEEWLEFAELVFGPRSAVLSSGNVARYGLCGTCCGKSTYHGKMLKRKGEAMLGHGYLYFNELLVVDVRLNQSVGVEFLDVTVENICETAHRALVFSYSRLQRRNQVFVLVPAGVKSEDALQLAKRIFTKTDFEALEQKRQKEREESTARDLRRLQDGMLLHPPLSRHCSRTAFSAQIREHYLLLADLFVVCASASIFGTSEVEPVSTIGILQTLPASLGVVAFVVVFKSERGSRLAHAVYFSLVFSGFLLACVAFVLIVIHFAELADELQHDCEAELNGWGGLAVAAFQLVVIVWAVPLRISALLTGFALARNFDAVVANDVGMKTVPHHARLEKVQVCWMTFIQYFCLPQCCRTHDHHQMHTWQHTAQLIYEVIIGTVAAVKGVYVTLFSIACGLLGAGFGLRGYHAFDVMLNMLAVYFSIIITALELAKFTCDDLVTQTDWNWVLNLFFFALIADCIRLSNVLKAFLENEQHNWHKIAEQYTRDGSLSTQVVDDYHALKDESEDDMKGQGSPIARAIATMQEDDPEGSRPRAYSTPDAPPPSTTNSTSSSPNQVSLYLQQEPKALGGLPSNRSSFMSASPPNFPASTCAPPPSPATSSPPKASASYSMFYPPAFNAESSHDLASVMATPVQMSTNAPPPSPMSRALSSSPNSLDRSLSAQVDVERANSLALISGPSTPRLQMSTAAPASSPASSPPKTQGEFMFPLSRGVSAGCPDLSVTPPNVVSTVVPPPSPATDPPSPITSGQIQSFSDPAQTATGTPRVPSSERTTPATSTVAPPPSPSSSSSSNQGSENSR